VDIKKLCGYSHNGYPTPTLLPAGRVWETYYSYPTRPANISNFTCFEKNVWKFYFKNPFWTTLFQKFYFKNHVMKIFRKVIVEVFGTYDIQKSH